MPCYSGKPKNQNQNPSKGVKRKRRSPAQCKSQCFATTKSLDAEKKTSIKRSYKIPTFVRHLDVGRCNTSQRWEGLDAQKKKSTKRS
jgi:hypothetical protein